MIQNMFSTGSMPLLEQAVYFSNMRHKVISNNIANVETPNYKALDMSNNDFLKMLNKAVEESRSYDTRPVLINADRENDSAYEIREKLGGILRHDGNNVDMETEMVDMVKNKGMHNLSAQILSHQFGVLRSAISGRVS